MENRYQELKLTRVSNELDLVEEKEGGIRLPSGLCLIQSHAGTISQNGGK